jgi:hypothetical protein
LASQTKTSQFTKTQFFSLNYVENSRRNFETIQYALCHRKFSYMINQKFMELCTLQDPNMKMCTLVVYPDPSSFPL